jgi:hypothetical protein
MEEFAVSKGVERILFCNPKYLRESEKVLGQNLGFSNWLGFGTQNLMNFFNSLEGFLKKLHKSKRSLHSRVPKKLQ